MTAKKQRTFFTTGVSTCSLERIQHTSKISNRVFEDAETQYLFSETL